MKKRPFVTLEKLKEIEEKINEILANMELLN